MAFFVTGEQPITRANTEFSGTVILTFEFFLRIYLHNTLRKRDLSLLYLATLDSQDNYTTALTFAMASDEYSPYVPIASLRHELGLMFGFLSLYIVVMGAYVTLWRGEFSPFHHPSIIRSARPSVVMSNT